MKKWWPHLALALVLAALAGTASRWLPPLAARAGASANELEGLANLVQLILWLSAGLVALARLIRRPPPPAFPVPPDLLPARAAYLRYLVDRYQFLDIKGMGVTDKLALRLPLMELYVPLNARVALPDGDAWQRVQRLAGRKLTDEEAEVVGRSGVERQPVLEVLAQSPGLVLLGDPGAGKSTFLKYLALSLASGSSPSPSLAGYLPVVLALSAYAEAIADEDLSLVEFVSRHYKARGLAAALGPVVEAVLGAGKALVLFDGLDEVKDLGRRHLVAGRLTDFFNLHRRAGNRFVLTSRIVGYREVRLACEGLLEATLIDFDDEEIEAFVGKWTGAIERAARGAGEAAAFEAKREREELLSAIQHNEGVRLLAANPLLLTILALMKRQGVALPDRRVDLYRNCVEVLLKHWSLARNLAGRGGTELPVVETLRVLAPVALWMQKTSPGAGLVKEEDLRRELVRVLAERGQAEPAAAADKFLEDLRQHCGLLIDRGGRQFGFLHLTFQEYLAAVGLRQLNQQSTEGIVAELAAHLDEAPWREVILLSVGYLGIVQQQDEVASAVVEGLLTCGKGEPGAAVELAGAAVADAWPGGVTAACRERVVETLLSTLSASEAVKAPWRAVAGRTLARLGDPRLEVLHLDAMQFCCVPAGPFLMGSKKGEEDSYEGEWYQHEVTLGYDYWMARFPVTVAQWAEYCDLGRHEPEDRDSLRGAANEPAVWVSWREARAFCDWLTEHWREKELLPAGWSVRLPSEAEWEKSARGGLAYPERLAARGVGELAEPLPAVGTKVNEDAVRRYPWFGEDDPGRRNGIDSGVRRVSAVGCFPGGRSPYGCEDMSGNVWEWTRSLWGEDASEPKSFYPYPDQPERENLEAPDEPLRVVRGGSCFDVRASLRCAARNGVHIGYQLNGVGFRVVVVSPFSSGL